MSIHIPYKPRTPLNIEPDAALTRSKHQALKSMLASEEYRYESSPLRRLGAWLNRLTTTLRGIRT